MGRDAEVSKQMTHPTKGLPDDTVADLGLSLGTGVSEHATLQAWYDDCAAGDMTACDDLFFQSPYDSEFERFGSTCGGRSDPTDGNCD